MTPLLLLCQIVLVAAVVTLALSRRRAALPDDHPHCRRCGFDLFGLAEGREHCPECGAALSSPKAIVRGQRRVQPKVAATGVSLLFLGVCLGGAAWIRDSGINLVHYKPVWWLVRDTHSANPQVVNEAVQELSSRMINGRLSQETERKLLDTALKLQEQTQAPWLPRWGDLVEQAYMTGALSEADLHRYIEQGIGMTLEWRPLVAIDAPWPVEPEFDPRVAYSGRYEVRYRVRLEQFGDQPIADRVFEGQTVLPQRWRRRYNPTLELLPSLSEVAPDVAPGRHKVRWTVEVEAAHRMDPGLAHTWTQTFEGKVDVLPAGSPTATVHADPTLNAQMIAAIEAYPAPSFGGGTTLVVSAERPPVGIAADVVVRQGDQQWEPGQVAFEPGEEAAAVFRDTMPGLDFSQPVEITLEPSLDAAELSAGLTQAWGEPIVLRAVESPFMRGRP